MVATPRQIARGSGEKFYAGADCAAGHGGLRYVSNGSCVECVRMTNEARDDTTPERRTYYREYAHKWRRRKPARYMLNSARNRAKQLGVPFDLTEDDVVVPDTCPALGAPLAFGDKSDGSPSLDRLDPTKGYVSGNVRVISNRANRIKSNATSGELRAVADYIDREKGDDNG